MGPGEVRKDWLYWTPRLLGGLYAAFTTVFAADVLDAGESWLRVAGALLLHLVPSFLLVVLLVVAWRRELLGGIVYLGLGLAYVAWAWGRFPGITSLIMAGPLLVIGALFLARGRPRQPRAPRHEKRSGGLRRPGLAATIRSCSRV